MRRDRTNNTIEYCYNNCPLLPHKNIHALFANLHNGAFERPVAIVAEPLLMVAVPTPTPGSAASFSAESCA